MDAEQRDAARVDLDVLMEQMRGYPPKRIAAAMWDWMEAQGFRVEAHTPTDDEREDMIAFLLRDHNFEESPWGRTYTDAEIANALRRSEVPEPSAEGPAFIALMPPSPETSKRWYSMYCRVCGIEEMMAGTADDPRLLARRDEHNRKRHSEPQGEPSDAPTRRVAHTGPGHASGDAGYCEGCLADYEQGATGRIPGEPLTLGDLAQEHERLAEHPNQMSQTIPAFHTLTAKALRWAALRAAGVGGVR